MNDKVPITETKNYRKPQKQNWFTALFERYHEHKFSEWKTLTKEKEEKNCVEVRSCYCGKKEKRIAYKYSKGFTYRVIDKKSCEITSLGTIEGGEVHIPRFIGKYKVTSVNCQFGFIISHNHITRVTIPNTVKNISRGAFLLCDDLKSVTLAEGIEEINDKTFSWCSKLTEIKIPSSVKWIGSKAFCGCSNLKKVTLPEGLTEITDGLFEHCYDLEEINIPKTVKSIWRNAFKGCGKLGEITLPDGLTDIGGFAFESCDFKKIKLGTGLKSIGEGAFKYCRLESITIPDGVKRINDGAFEHCGNLKSVVIPDSVEILGKAVFKDTDNEFWIQNGLQSLTIGSGATNIGEEFCSGCHYLKYLKIGENVKKIETSAFESCFTLEEVYLPDAVEIIEKRAFGFCRGLKTISIGKGIKEIEKSAFFNSGITCIEFRGKKTQWLAVKKALFWDLTLEDYTIKCTDGEIIHTKRDNTY